MGCVQYYGQREESFYGETTGQEKRANYSGYARTD